MEGIVECGNNHDTRNKTNHEPKSVSFHYSSRNTAYVKLMMHDTRT
jgi:hypothetical protein